MSKLDDIWNDMQILMEEVDTDDRNDFKQAVKALMLDLIDNTGVYRSEIGHWTVDSETLKKKVEEL